jgi:hypothetical protein
MFNDYCNNNNLKKILFISSETKVFNFTKGKTNIFIVNDKKNPYFFVKKKNTVVFGSDQQMEELKIHNKTKLGETTRKDLQLKKGEPILSILTYLRALLIYNKIEINYYQFKNLKLKTLVELRNERIENSNFF